MKYEPSNVYLADAYEAIKELPDKSVDLIYCDPPYEFNMGEGAGAFGTKERNYHAEYLALYKETGSTKETERLRINANKVRQREQYRAISKGFDFGILDEFVRVLKKINVYIWCSKAQVSKILTYFEEKGCSIDILTWHKTNPTPTINNTYANDTEYCIFAREKGVPVYGSYETKKKYFVSPANVKDKEKFEHPTIKPLQFVQDHITNSTNQGDIVLDPFCGSGTTLVVAKNLDRKYIGFEISEKWHKVATDRLNNINAHGQMSIFTM